MTTPILSIKTTEEIGRLYQKPNGGYSGDLHHIAARKGLADGTLFPSITNIISSVNPNMEGYVSFMIGKGLREGMEARDALKNHIVYRDGASDRGTRVHKFIEDFIDAGYADEHYLTFMAHKNWKTLPSFIACEKNNAVYGDFKHIQAFFAFIKEFKPKFIVQEATVYGKTTFGQEYAGTTDFIAEINGKTIVGDWKTSSKMSGTVALQLSAVIYADQMTTDFENLTPVPHIDEAWGIHLDKDGTYGVYKAIDPKEAFTLFSHARAVWDFYINKKSTLTKI